MSCILHFSTGKNTGLVCPYDAADYHTWKSREADLILNNKEKTKLTGADKAYHVKWTGKVKMNNCGVVKTELFTEKYEKHFEIIEGNKPSFSVTRGGGFNVKIDGASNRVGHLDVVARPLWETKDTRTH